MNKRFFSMQLTMLCLIGNFSPELRAVDSATMASGFLLGIVTTAGGIFAYKKYAEPYNSKKTIADLQVTINATGSRYQHLATSFSHQDKPEQIKAQIGLLINTMSSNENEMQIERDIRDLSTRMADAQQLLRSPLQEQEQLELKSALTKAETLIKHITCMYGYIQQSKQVRTLEANLVMHKDFYAPLLDVVAHGSQINALSYEQMIVVQNKAHARKAQSSLGDLLREDTQFLQDTVNACKKTIAQGNAHAYTQELARFVANAELVLEQLKKAVTVVHEAELFLPLYDERKREKERLYSYESAVSNGTHFPYVALAKQLNDDYKQIEKRVKPADKFCIDHECTNFNKTLVSYGKHMLEELKGLIKNLAQSSEYINDLEAAKNHDILAKQHEHSVLIELNKASEMEQKNKQTELQLQEAIAEQKKYDTQKLRKKHKREIDECDAKINQLQKKLTKEQEANAQKTAEYAALNDVVTSQQKTINQYQSFREYITQQINEVGGLSPQSDEFAAASQAAWDVLKEALKKIPVH